MGARRLNKLGEVQQSVRDKYQESPGTIICTTCDVTKREDVKEELGKSSRGQARRR